MSEPIIILKEYEEAAKNRKKILAAKNKASFLIEDAKARHIKEKTRAKKYEFGGTVAYIDYTNNKVGKRIA